MGREIRRVPPDWVHPLEDREDDKRGMGYKPQKDKYYVDAVNEWYRDHLRWLKGKHPLQLGPNKKRYAEYRFYEDYAGTCPSYHEYRWRNWMKSEATHFQMYENVTEGTPVTPIFASLQDLENWLVEKGEIHGVNGITGENLWDRENARAFCKAGSKPTFYGYHSDDGRD